MDFQPYEIISNENIAPDVFIFRFKPTQAKEVFSFIPGQFCQIKNPTSDRPNQPHLFSIASSPHTKEYLEFCIKQYGPWTHALAQKKVGETVEINGPLGKFTWDNAVQHAVFLAGGVGVAPIMSMLRYINEEHLQPRVTLLYGNRDQASIAYGDEIKQIIANLKNGKVVDILSDIAPDHPWQGYRGFLTKDILEKEVDVEPEPTFFLCGPPIFVQLAKELVAQINIEPARIKQEIYSAPVALKTAAQ